MHQYTVAVPGCTLHYSIQGSGCPLLLLPTLGGEAWWHYQLLPVLAAHFQVITYDRRGCGHSIPSGYPACISTQAHDALAVLRAAGVAAAHIIGMGSGGVVALDLATHAPQAVRSVLAFEPPLARLHPEEGRRRQFVTDIFAQACKGGPAWAGLTFALGAGLPGQALLRTAHQQQAWQEAGRLRQPERPVTEAYLDFITTVLYLPAPQLFAAGPPVYAGAGIHSIAQQGFYAPVAMALADQAGTPLMSFPGHHLSAFQDTEAWGKALVAHLHALP